MNLATSLALFLGLSVLLVLLVANGKSKLLKPDPGTLVAFSVSCMDLRFVQTNNAFLRRTYGYNAYDSFVCPGPAASLGKSVGLNNGGILGKTLLNALLVDSPTDLVDSTFYNSFIRARTISKLVNTTEELVIMEHEQCGYYDALAGVTLEPDVMKASQIANLRTVRLQLLRDHGPSVDQLFDSIKMYWVSIFGEVFEVLP
jgi:hypothetical protein